MDMVVYVEGGSDKGTNKSVNECYVMPVLAGMHGRSGSSLAEAVAYQTPTITVLHRFRTRVPSAVLHSITALKMGCRTTL